MLTTEAYTCRLREWDSEFFAFPIAEITVKKGSISDFSSALNWCYDNKVECVYLLLPASDVATIRHVEESGFRLADIRTTLACSFDPTLPIFGPACRPSVICRPHQPGDIPKLMHIASTAHDVTRFYTDTRFPRRKCSRLYSEWIRKSCEENFSDIVLVSESKGEPCGYITCKLDREKPTGQIGLVGVAEFARGRGVGGSLVSSALEWFASNEVESVSVVTQGQNKAALKLYQRFGFDLLSLDLWFHKWFSGV